MKDMQPTAPRLTPAQTKRHYNLVVAIIKRKHPDAAPTAIHAIASRVVSGQIQHISHNAPTVASEATEEYRARLTQIEQAKQKMRTRLVRRRL